MNPHNPSPAPQQSSLPARRMKADGTNIDYGYSTHGELETVTIPGEGLLSVNPFNWRVPAQITLPSGTQQNKHYDGLLNLTATLFIKTRNSNNLDIFAYYHHDHLGTPVQATDKQGNVVWAASYHAFGMASIITPAATPDIPTITSNLRLPGQYADEETGLYYNLNRYYDPATGNYRTRDPIGIEGGINTYSYADNAPTMKTDPLGLATYMCTRNLSNVPFRFGPLYHQYICVPDGKGGQTCGGLGPSGKMFDSPGVIEYEKTSSPSSCEKAADDNSCIEKCIQDEFKKPPPNYSVDLSQGQNCQTWAHSAVSSCQAQCRGKK